MTKLSTFSTLEHSVNGLEERFYDPTTGFECVWNMDNTTDSNGTLPYTGRIINLGTWEPESTFALQWLMQFIPKTISFTPLGTDELTDNVKSSHQTGPSNRRYYAPALRFAIDADPTRQQKGRDALVNYNLCQINRPLSHQWLVPPKTDLTVDKGTPYEWNSDKQTTAGWDAFDVAHNDLSPEFALAALNHPLGLMNSFMVWRWFISQNPPGTTFWMNQPRAIGWSLKIAAEAHYLFPGMEQSLVDKYCKGYTPAKALKGYVDQLLSTPVAPELDDNFAPPDTRVMTVITDAKGKAIDWVGPSGTHYGKQIYGCYSWQAAVRQFGYGYALKSNILDITRAQNLQKRAEDEIEIFLEYCLDSVKGMSWAFGSTEFINLEDIEQLLTDVTSYQVAHNIKLTRPYEIHDVGGKSIYHIREVATTQDLELHLPAWALIKGPFCEEIELFLNKLPKPGNGKYQAKHMDIVYALRGQ